MMKKGDGNRPPRPTASLIFFVAALMLPSLREAGPIYQEAEKTRAALQHEVTVTLKLIQVTVTDKKGNPVSDLHKDEFVLYDNGKRQNLTEFELHVVRLPAPHKAPAEEQVVSTPTAPSRLLNRRIFLFFDFAQTDWRGASKAAEAARHFVDTSLLPTDEVGVISFSAQRSLQVHEFLTTDHQKILRILESFGLRSAAESGLDAEERYAQSLKEGAIPDARPERKTSYQSAMAPKMPTADLESMERWIAQNFIWNLKTFAQALRYLPGQKILILFSYGITGRLINQEPPSKSDERSSLDIASTEGRYGMNMDLRRAYTELCRELATSNISIYPINTQGITAASEMKSGAATLREMAQTTGGRYFGNIDFVDRHLGEVQILTGTFYVLGYPVGEAWDGKYHKIKVEVTRPGCTVRAQAGYFNPKPFAEYSDLEKLIHLVDLALAEKPLFQAPVRFAMRAMPMSSRPPDNLGLVAAVNLDELGAVAGRKVEIYYLAFDPADEIIDSHRVEITLEKPGNSKAFLFETLSAPPGTYKCRIVLRNSETGRAAVSAAEGVVPEPTAEELRLYPPLLLAPEKGALYLGGKGTGDSALNSAIGSIVRAYPFDPEQFAPYLDNSLQNNSNVWAAVRCDGAKANSSNLRLSAFLLESLTGEQIPVPLEILAEKSEQFSKTFFIQLHIPEVEPDTYAFRLTAEDGVGGASSQIATNFIIQ
jgi:VWFA-related protein